MNKSQFLNINAEKLGFIIWNFLIVVNPHFPSATPGRKCSSQPNETYSKEFSLEYLTKTKKPLSWIF